MRNIAWYTLTSFEPMESQDTSKDFAASQSEDTADVVKKEDEPQILLWCCEYCGYKGYTAPGDRKGRTEF